MTCRTGSAGGGTDSMTGGMNSTGGKIDLTTGGIGPMAGVTDSIGVTVGTQNSGRYNRRCRLNE